MPVPGISGVTPRPVPRTRNFGNLLQQLLPPGSIHPLSQHGAGRGAARSATPSSAVGRRFLVPRPPAYLAPPARREPAATSGAPARHQLAADIRNASSSAGVAPELSVAVARVESNLDPRARSRDGKSVGTFQVTHATAAEMRRKIAHGTVARPPGSDDVALGVGYLRYLHDLFGRRARLGRGVETVPVHDGQERQLFAVAAFNAGEGSVARAQARAAANGGDPTRFEDVRRFLPAITQGYVERVAYYAQAGTPTATPA